MIKMAIMPMNGKTLLKSSPKPEVQWPLGLVCSVLDVGLPSCSNDDPKLTVTYLTSKSNFLPSAF